LIRDILICVAGLSRKNTGSLGYGFSSQGYAGEPILTEKACYPDLLRVMDGVGQNLAEREDWSGTPSVYLETAHALFYLDREP